MLEVITTKENNNKKNDIKEHFLYEFYHHYHYRVVSLRSIYLSIYHGDKYI